MPCYHPLIAWRSPEKGHLFYVKHRPTIVFNEPYPAAKGFNLPCGRCIGCRLNYSRMWAIRCVHEAKMHKHNSFITLTYNNDYCPEELDIKQFQLFMKRLRKKISVPIRFFQCGEYGEKTQRPHFHSLIFGYDFPDKKILRTRDGISLYTSQELSELWPYGFSTIGELTFQSAAYTARYIMKKQKGDQNIDPVSGVVTPNPISSMSRKPGIGQSFFLKYKSDIYPHDYVHINGHKVKPPRYYDELLKGNTYDDVYPSLEYQALKAKRIEKAELHDTDEALEKLFIQEKVKIAQLDKLVRNLS